MRTEEDPEQIHVGYQWRVCMEHIWIHFVQLGLYMNAVRVVYTFLVLSWRVGFGLYHDAAKVEKVSGMGVRGNIPVICR